MANTTTDKLNRLRQTKVEQKTMLQYKGFPLTDETPWKDYTQYIQNLTNTSDGDITPENVTRGKVGYANGVKITGTLEPNTGQWEPDPKWWDIYGILAADYTPGYVAKMIILYDDQWHTNTLGGARAYRLSDGRFIERPNTSNFSVNYTPISTLTPDQYEEYGYKQDSRGYTTKYIIYYWTTNDIRSYQTLLMTAGYPIYVVAKDCIINFNASFFSGPYALQAYEHINCQYTGNAIHANFFGGNQKDLQKVPQDWDFSNITTWATNAFGGSTTVNLKYFNLTTVNWANIAAPTTVLGSIPNLDEIEGVIDLSRDTTTANIFTSWLRIRKCRVIGLNHTCRLWTQSTAPNSLYLQVIQDLPDNTGNPTKTLSMSTAVSKTLTPSQISIATAKNWVIAN